MSWRPVLAVARPLVRGLMALLALCAKNCLPSLYNTHFVVIMPLLDLSQQQNTSKWFGLGLFFCIFMLPKKAWARISSDDCISVSRGVIKLPLGYRIR